MTIQKEDEETEEAGGSRSRIVMERTREEQKELEEREVEGKREKDEKVAGTYVRYAGEKHPGGAPAVPPTFKVPVASGPRVPPGAPR